jgi:hypothetical protein
MRRYLAGLVGIVLFAGLLLLAHAKDAPGGLEGEWSVNNWIPGSSLGLTISYRDAHTRWSWSSTQSLDSLPGLTREQLQSLHAPVTFALVRDAGTFMFTGTVVMGIGHGEYRFVADPSYLMKLTALGYDTSGSADRSAASLVVHDISLQFAAAVKRSGVRIDTLADLVKLRDHGVETPYLAKVQAAGFEDLTVDQILKLHDHGVD